MLKQLNNLDVAVCDVLFELTGVIEDHLGMIRLSDKSRASELMRITLSHFVRDVTELTSNDDLYLVEGDEVTPLLGKT